MMDLKKYPFLKRSQEDKSRPLLPILLTNPETKICVPTYGLIDTGSDDCVIPSQYAEYLGHNVVNGQPEMRVAAGSEVKGFRHTFEIEIYGLDHNCEINYDDNIHTLPDSLILCMFNLNIVILGVNGFLENFSLMISYPREEFSLVK